MDIDQFGPDLVGFTVDPIVSDSFNPPACNYCSSLILGTVIDLVADKTVLVDFTNIPFFKF